MRFGRVALLALLLTACSPSNVIEKGLTPQERSVMRGAIGDISQGNSASLVNKVPPTLATDMRLAFEPMRAAMPKPPLKVSMTNGDWMTRGGVRTAHAVYQVQGRSGWALVDLVSRTAEGSTSLTEIYVRPTRGDPRDLNRLSLRDASFPKILMLVLMVAAIAATVAALVRVWRSGLFGRRWLWTIGSLIGVSTLRLNWTTGHFFFQPISLLLFSAAATKQPIYAPWVLSVGFPLVALIALLKRGQETSDGVGANTDAD